MDTNSNSVMPTTVILAMMVARFVHLHSLGDLSAKKCQKNNMERDIRDIWTCQAHNSLPLFHTHTKTDYANTGIISFAIVFYSSTTGSFMFPVPL